MIESTPFTENATEHEADVLRLMVYMTYIMMPGMFDDTVEAHNKSFENAEELLEKLGGDPDEALSIIVEDGDLRIDVSEKFADILAETEPIHS